MSAAPAAPHSDGEEEEEEYRRPSKRLKTAVRQAEEREEGEDELEEGEDSDSGSLPGEGEPAVDHRARWTCSQYRGGRKVRGAGRRGVPSGAAAPPSSIHAFLHSGLRIRLTSKLSGLRARTRLLRAGIAASSYRGLLSSSLQKELRVMT